MENYWHLGRWGRIPVSMHWTVLLIFPWLFLWLNDWLAALIGSGAYFLLLLAHEFGHAAVARWRRVAVDGITLNGLHGETSHAYPRSTGDDILIAWGGVAAQVLVLLLTLLATPWIEFSSHAVWTVAAPVIMVFTRWNLFLMVVALLPIGPMDGRRAWAVIPWLRQRFRRRGSSGGKVVKLDPAKRRALQQQSEKAAADILQKLGKKK